MYGSRATTAVLSFLAVFGLLTPAAAAAPDADLPTRAAVKDFRDDVVKSGTSRGRSHDLDVYKVSAAAVDETLRIVLTIDDLKPRWTAAPPPGEWQTTQLAAIVKIDGKRHIVAYGAEINEPYDDFRCSIEHPETGGAKQSVDYDKDTVTFAIPVACLPEDQTTAKVTAYTMMQTKSGARRLDHVNRAKQKHKEKYTPLISYR